MIAPIIPTMTSETPRNRANTVSAVLPTWNRKQYIARALDSMLSQSLPPDEILVIDDGSSDGTSEYIRRHYGERVRVIEQPNTGVGGALYRGIQEARYEWIAINNSDDEWTPDRNRRFVEAASRISDDVVWLFGDTQVVTDEGASKNTLFSQHNLNITGDLEIFTEPLSTQYPIQLSFLQSSFIRRKALLEMNCFSEALRSSEDVLAGFQLACRYKFAALPFIATRLFRTTDLRESSLDFLCRCSPDYFRARIKAFSTAQNAGKPGPWAQKHAEAVRGLCKVLLERGESPRALALQQFRFGISAKSLLFFLTALAGPSGYQLWKRAAAARVRHQAPVVLWGEVKY
jgi:hypothetical protein